MKYLLNIILIASLLLLPALPAKPRPLRCYLTGRENAMVCRCNGVSLPERVCDIVNGKRR